MGDENGSETAGTGSLNVVGLPRLGCVAFWAGKIVLYVALFSDFFNGVFFRKPEGTNQMGKEVEDWIGERKSRLLLNSMKS
jgi:hypothetical protein